VEKNVYVVTLSFDTIIQVIQAIIEFINGTIVHCSNRVPGLYGVISQTKLSLL